LAATTHRLLAGSEFAGAYRIVRAIGHGAMGTVYLAERLDGSGNCALKVLKPSVARDPRAGERFAREARVGERIGDPRVVEVVATGFDDKTSLHWLAMELVDGLPLGDWWKQRAPEVEVRVALVRQLGDVMAAAHRAGVIHRDLKPENIMVVDRPDGPEMKLLDFGVAKTFMPSMIASATEGGLGTPLWTAPEQAKGGELRPSVDVWAIGLLGFYLLTGKIYWRHANDKGASMLDLAVEMLKEPIAPASERAAALGVPDVLSPGFDGWFFRCVERDAQKRFADAVEARDAFVALQAPKKAWWRRLFGG
jgi:eukaryotic-like serine/threonine-protein kinase